MRAGIWSGLADVLSPTSLFLLGFAFPGWFSSQNLWVCHGRPRWQLLQTLGHHNFHFICSLSMLFPRVGTLCSHQHHLLTFPLPAVPIRQGCILPSQT